MAESGSEQNTKPQQQNAKPQERMPPGDALSKFERRVLTATWAGVVVAAGTGILIYSQFRVMSDQTLILSSQTISAAADSIESGRRVERQLAIAEQQAIAAKDSAEAIQRQMRQDQRPWVRITTGALKLSENDFLRIPVHIASLGKTPARTVRTDIVIRKISRNEPLQFLYDAHHDWDTEGILYTDAPVQFEATGGPTKISGSDLRDLNEGRAYVIFYGTTTYTDLFQKQHWTKFCGWTAFKTGNYPAQKCTSYNDVDNN